MNRKLRLIAFAAAVAATFAAAAAEYVREQSRRPRLVVVEPVEADPQLESALSPNGVPTPSTGAPASPP